MKSTFVRELEPNTTIQDVFLVSAKDVRYKKSGDPYLSLILSDKTGELDAKMWDNAAEASTTFERDDFVRVKGLVQVFQDKPQLNIHKLQPVADAAVDLADFLPASTRDRDEMFAELLAWIEGMQNPHLKGLLAALLSDPDVARRYRTAPAAKGVHHAWIGGLIEHVLSMCKLARFTAGHYPDIDFDLLLSGVILHDIGKIHELSYERSFRYSDAGQLLGHIHIGTQMVQEKLAGMPDFPQKLRDLLLHMILSHHGLLEYGSPKVPVFAEAMLLHQIDVMDSKMETMRSTVERDRHIEGTWTGYSRPLERTVLKKDAYLAQPAESRRAQPTQAAASDTISETAQAQPKGNSGNSHSKSNSGSQRSTSTFGNKLLTALGDDRDGS